MADTERNKELVQRFWQSRPKDQAAFLTDDAVWHLPTSIAQRTFGGVQDLRGDAATAIFTAATGVYEPGGSMDVLHVVAEDDLVTLHCQLHTDARRARLPRLVPHVVPHRGRSHRRGVGVPRHRVPGRLRRGAGRRVITPSRGRT